MAKNKTVNGSSTTVPACFPVNSAAPMAGRNYVIQNKNSEITDKKDIPVIPIESKDGREQ